MNKSPDTKRRMKKFFSLDVRSAAELRIERPGMDFLLKVEVTEEINEEFSVVLSVFHIFDNQLDFCSLLVS